MRSRQRQADQVDIIMFGRGDPLNYSWCLPGSRWQAGGGQAGAVMFPLGIG